jgi:uncharacterized delta-60 repeat protein
MSKLTKSLPLFAAGIALVASLAQATVDTAWVRRWDGSAHQDDWAEAMTVDSAGNVYVTGVTETDTINGHYDIITLKYGPTGELQWGRQYGNPGTLERPSAVAVDRQGNVYVTGYGNGRILTLKYSSAGQLLWSLPFGSQGGAADLALDVQGNALLCGSVLRTADSFDMVTIKYRPSGDSAWVRLLDWAGGDEDARGLSVAPQGGLCVTAAGYDTRPGSTCLTVSYDSTGTRQWLAVYDGPADWDSPADIAVDSGGSVYVTGKSEGTSSPWDYLTVKYNSAGESLWTRRYNGAANGWDEARAVATDTAGAVIVTGRSFVMSTNPNAATIKYGSDGTLQWVALFGGPIANWGEGNAVAVDETGNVYVGGASAFPGGAYADFATIKYNAAGETVWVRSYNGPGNSVDNCSASALGRDGSVCVTGRSYGPGGTNQDIVTIRYAERGAVEERATLDAPREVLITWAGPSPFTARTAVNLHLAASGRARLEVHSAAGRLVRTLVDGLLPAGSHTLGWDGTDDDGLRVPAGVYSVRLVTEQVKQSVKVVVLD